VTNSVFTISSGDSTMRVDHAGEWIELTGAGKRWIEQTRPFWRLTAQAPSDASSLGRRREAVPAASPAIRQSAGGLHLRYNRFTIEGRPVNIVLDISISAADGDFVFTFTVENQSPDWILRELRGPIVRVDLDEPAHPALIWPSFGGMKFPDAARAGVMSESYPSGLAFSWMGLDYGASGLYMAAHDSELETIQLNVGADPVGQEIDLSISHFPFCGEGRAATTVDCIIRPYEGTWHCAAERYRAWLDTWRDPVVPPSWVRGITGMQLAIMKQQNGDIHWTYRDLDRLVDLGTESGLNLLGLYGWTEGGHDRQYPVYDVSDEMGGEQALREGIERAHSAGQRVILYTNGQLRDISSDWHQTIGRETAAVSERGEPFGECWQKYRDAPVRLMTYACQSAAPWSDLLLSLARKVESLGADGILFDQLGICQPPFCFSDRHGHDGPARATGPGVTANLLRIQREMNAVNPDFIIMVEVVNDGINQYADFTHGCGPSFSPGEPGFPELLRFTWPELLVTQRHDAPAIDRESVNWACLHGFAHEVEYRYEPDRSYVERRQPPEFLDYARVCGFPSAHIETMQRTDAGRCFSYLRSVIAFERRHADLLRGGAFRDTLGFDLDNPALVAKAYVRHETLGIVVWNPTDQPQPVRIAVERARFEEWDEPGAEAASGNADRPIPPRSLRLMIYRTMEKTS